MLNIPKIFKQDDSGGEAKLQLPLLPLRDIVVFPHMVVPLFVGREKSINALSRAMENDKNIFLATQNDASIDDPNEKHIYKVGTIGTVLQLLRLPDGTVKALVEGKIRAQIVNFISKDEAFEVELKQFEEGSISKNEEEALLRTILEVFKEYSTKNTNISKDIVNNVNNITNATQFADTISAHVPFKISDKQNILEMTNIKNRLNTLLKLLKNESEIFTMGQKIKGRVQSQISKTQKNYYLNEQMRAIKKEMGNEDSFDDDLKDFEKRIKSKRMSKDAHNKVQHELKKLKMMSPMSAEANVIRNYIDWLLDLPWFKRTKINNNLNEAEKILDEDHYGLEKSKERILEHLAVQTLVKKLRGPILCLVGPPGVGKTSLAKSVARATGRIFIRFSLGGVRDEAEIRGHRRTYVGAMPGKIIQNLKKAKFNNPVFCLDEVDKMTTDFRGDPSSALLEVLDPEQNYSFNDHFLDLDYDLSNILFITTANTLHDIPLPLQDRMEIINISGYTEYEKYNIAKDFLIPKLIKTNGLTEENVNISKTAIFDIIQRFTREAGVRNLERELSTVCRKIAFDFVKNKSNKTFNVSKKSLIKYLGQPKFRHGQIEEKDMVGIVTGLAWTQFGGELLCIETVVIPGKGQLIVTGKLGEVMQESARAAVSYVRSRSDKFKIDQKFYRKFDIHIHVPEGAIPKDGPSAGITMCTAIVSALTKRQVHRNIAMTGEITLRGRVLPIGGIREKLLAAHRGGITKVIIPKDNEKDIRQIPSSIMKQMEILSVNHLDDVLLSALIFEGNDSLFGEKISNNNSVRNEDHSQTASLN